MAQPRHQEVVRPLIFMPVVPSLGAQFRPHWMLAHEATHALSDASRPALSADRRPQSESAPPQPSALPLPHLPMTVIDSMLGGSLLVGQKTLLGIVAYVALVAMHNLGLQPVWLTAELYELSYTLAAGLAGVGFVSKFERFARSEGWRAGKVEAYKPPEKPRFVGA